MEVAPDAIRDQAYSNRPTPTACPCAALPRAIDVRRTPAVSGSGRFGVWLADRLRDVRADANTDAIAATMNVLAGF